MPKRQNNQNYNHKKRSSESEQRTSSIRAGSGFSNVGNPVLARKYAPPATLVLQPDRRRSGGEPKARMMTLTLQSPVQSGQIEPKPSRASSFEDDQEEEQEENSYVADNQGTYIADDLCRSNLTVKYKSIDYGALRDYETLEPEDILVRHPLTSPHTFTSTHMTPREALELQMTTTTKSRKREHIKRAETHVTISGIHLRFGQDPERSEVGRRPVRMECPNCRTCTTSVISWLITPRTNDVAFWLSLLCLCCLPYVTHRWKVAEHYCPNCRAFLGASASH